MTITVIYHMQFRNFLFYFLLENILFISYFNIYASDSYIFKYNYFVKLKTLEKIELTMLKNQYFQLMFTDPFTSEFSIANISQQK